MWTKLTALVTAFLLLLAATGCNRPSEAAARKPTIGLAVSNLQADFFNVIKDSAQETAKKRDINLIVADARNDPVTQINQIQNFITRDVDAIIYLPAGAAAADVPVRDAHDAGIPVVTVDRNPSEEPGDTFIATASVKAAQKIGEHLISLTNGKGDVAVLQGQLGTTPEIARAKGFKKALKKAPGLNVVAKRPANWAQDQAFSVAQDMLQTHPEIDAFFGRADAMALGAAQAVRAANLEPRPVIVGFDGDFAGLKAVSNGTIDATMCQQTRRMGRMAIDSALDLAAGKQLPKEQLLPAYLVTKKNADRFYKNHP